jgi:membrane-associated phospholipid phosphatase
MVKVLLVLLWPVGIAGTAGLAVLYARRVPTLDVAGPGSPPARLRHRHGARPGAPDRALPGWVAGVARFLAVVIGGSIVVLLITWLLGLLVLHAGPPIDKPFYSWTQAHRMHLWARVMTSATKIGDAQATWAAAGTAGACLAVAWRRMRWLPPLALVTVVVLQKLVVRVIHHLVHRVGPPDSPHGVFPSGGCARAVLIYGLIAYLLWREFGGTRRTAAWAAAAVAVIGFNEGYSRLYLTLHWLTDVLSGWLYGGMLLVVFILAVRLVAGPGRAQAEASRASRVAAAPPPDQMRSSGGTRVPAGGQATAVAPASALPPTGASPPPGPAPSRYPEGYA